MGRLGHADTDRLLAAVQELYRETDPVSLSRTLVALTSRLIPCDICAFDAMNEQSGEFRSVNNYPSQEAERYFPAFMAHAAEHPRLAHHAKTGEPGALMISDFVTLRQFQRTALYNEFYRVFGIRHQLTCYLEGGGPHQLGMGLQSCGRRFRERDRVLLDRLRPHFSQAWTNARLMAGAQQQLAGWNAVETRWRMGLIALDARHRIEWATPQAQAGLESMFPGERRTPGALPASLEVWLRRQSTQATIEVTPYHRAGVTFEGAAGRMHVHWMPRSDQGCWLVLTTDQAGLEMRALSALGLTQRETEVLYWIAEGKTNPEIAIILSCSSNTVRKHLEHIFEKLGVETRGAAARKAIEFCRRSGGAMP